MKRLTVLLALCVAACGDDGPSVTPDARPDASIEIAPIAVTFEGVGGGASGPNTKLTFGPSGLLYSQQDGFLEVSSDQGITWTRKTQELIRLAATSSTLFATTLTSSGLRSTDGGTTFIPITIPGFAIGDVLFLHTAGQTAWALVTTVPSLAPKALARSTDQGATFTAVALPGTFAKATLTGGRDGTLFLVGDNHVYRTTDGAAWEDLGQFAEVMTVAATQAGTALLYERTAGQIRLHRRPVAAVVWTADPPGGQTVPEIVQRPNGELLRIRSGAAIDVSTTEGASWTPVLAMTSFDVYGVFALDTALVGVTYDNEVLQARFATGATAWTIPMPTALPGAGVGKFSDVTFTTSGRVILGGATHVYLSDDNGSTWRTGTYAFDTEPIRALAVKPNGTAIFAASTLGRWTLLAGDGNSALLEQDHPPPTQNFVQAQWWSDQLMFATTASTDNTEGALYNFDLDRSPLFQSINPFRVELNPTLTRTAGYHGIATCKYGESFAVLLGAREFTGTNGVQDHLLLNQGGGQGAWAEIDPPVGFGQALSISCSPNGAAALLYYDDRLFVSKGTQEGFHAVTQTTLAGKLLTAKFAPDGRLWVIGEAGVYRSSAPIVVP